MRELRETVERLSDNSLPHSRSLAFYLFSVEFSWTILNHLRRLFLDPRLSTKPQISAAPKPEHIEHFLHTRIIAGV